MRTFTPIFLIIILVLPILSIHTYKKIQNIRIEDEFNRKISSGALESEVVSLRLTRQQIHNEIHWLGKREFISDNFIYQIISFKYSGDITVFFCIKNPEKTRLIDEIANLYAHTTGANQQANEVHKILISFLKSLYYEYANIEFNSCFKMISKKYEYTTSYKSFKPIPDTPPPNLS